jgi:hypothetical protein
MSKSPVAIIYDSAGNEVTVTDGQVLGSTKGLPIAGQDGTNFQLIKTASDGTVKVDPSGTTAQPVTDNGGSLTVDGSVTVVDGGGSITVDGTVAVTDGGGTITVDDGGTSLTVDGTVTVVDGGGTLTVDDGGTSLTVDGTVAVTQSTSPWVTSNAASSQADGHSVTIGTTTDADTVNTVIGRLKKIISVLAGGLPAALTGSGNLKVAVNEAIAAGTNRIGAVRPVDANDVALDLARSTSIPSGTRGLLVVGEDGATTARALDVRVDPIDGIRRLQIEGKVVTAPAPPPPGGTAVTIAGDSPLSVSTIEVTNYIIPNGVTFYVQQIVAGAEGDPTEKGSKIEVYFYDGTTEHIVDRIYITGFTQYGSYPNTGSSRDGTMMTGNGTTKTIRVKRIRIGGSAQEIDAVVRGYYI